MKRFEEVKDKEMFRIPFFEIKPIDDNSELKQKYSLMMYQNNSKKTVLFIKTGDTSCMEGYTKTSFVYSNNKMFNSELGLYFFGSFVDDTFRGELADKEIVTSYFEDARNIRQQKENSMHTIK